MQGTRLEDKPREANKYETRRQTDLGFVVEVRPQREQWLALTRPELVV